MTPGTGTDGWHAMDVGEAPRRSPHGVASSPRSAPTSASPAPTRRVLERALRCRPADARARRRRCSGSSPKAGTVVPSPHACAGRLPPRGIGGLRSAQETDHRRDAWAKPTRGPPPLGCRRTTRSSPGCAPVTRRCSPRWWTPGRLGCCTPRGRTSPARTPPATSCRTPGSRSSAASAGSRPGRRCVPGSTASSSTPRRPAACATAGRSRGPACPHRRGQRTHRGSGQVPRRGR